MKLKQQKKKNYPSEKLTTTYILDLPGVMERKKAGVPLISFLFPIAPAQLLFPSSQPPNVAKESSASHNASLSAAYVGK